MYRTRDDKSGGVWVQAAAVKPTAQYRIFLDINFKEGLMNFSPGVKHARKLRRTFPTPAPTCGKSHLHEEF